MSTRRRVGISTATSEAARRQLIQPVPCWEKIWVKPESAPPGSTLKICKWVRADKVQQFSDDEIEADAPLAPLPDEPEAVDGDEELDQEAQEGQEENTAKAAGVPAQVEAGDAGASAEGTTSKQPTPPKPGAMPPPPKPTSPEIINQNNVNDTLDDSLKPPESSGINTPLDVGDNSDSEGMADIDMSQLPPDGTAYEDIQDMSQIQDGDMLLGGPEAMDQTTDPFAGQSSS